MRETCSLHPVLISCLNSFMAPNYELTSNKKFHECKKHGYSCLSVRAYKLCLGVCQLYIGVPTNTNWQHYKISINMVWWIGLFTPKLSSKNFQMPSKIISQNISQTCQESPKRCPTTFPRSTEHITKHWTHPTFVFREVVGIHREQYDVAWFEMLGRLLVGRFSYLDLNTPRCIRRNQ